MLAANLVAAYGFDEASGAAAIDSSGSGNGGTINGAARVAGRFGNALSFNGAGNVVDVPDSNSLDLTTGMTLEAWARPTSLAGYRTVAMKDVPGELAYSLYASGDVNLPNTWARVGGVSRDATGSTALPLNTWTHLASTYNGTTLLLYVNGVQAASRAVSGSIQVSANPFHIGGNAVWGEYFAGLIDEVRVYSRALTQAEIQTDMNTAVSAPVSDTVPPSVTSVGPLNGATAVATGANATVTFGETMSAASITASTFELRTSAGTLIPAAVTYNAATNTATLDPTAALPASPDYLTARVRGGSTGAKDAGGNPLSSDFTWSFTTGTPSFQDKVVFSGLTLPTVVRFSPDGRVFVAEKSGIIKVFDNLTDTTPTVFADLRTQVHNFWDRGLLGMALHPNFPTTPYVYVLYTYDGDVGQNNAPKFGAPNTDSDPGPDATGAGAQVSGRLSRLTASGNVMVTGSELVLVHDWAQQFPSHSIGSLQFGPDGALYASGGDGASFNYADWGQTGNPFGDPGGPAGANIAPPGAEGGALRSQDLRSPADPTTLDGSIIRIDPATGLALPTNPLYATGNDANAKRIIAHGLRNPFRFTVRPGTSELWIGDVGYNTWEEINRIAAPNDATVENFGWPAYEGAARQGGYDGANLTLLEDLYAAGPSAHNGPYYTYNHAAQVVAGSGEPTGGSSVSGLAFYTGGSYPAAYKGALFFADYSRDRIYVMYQGPDGNPDPNNRAIFVGPAIDPVHLEIGPGGDLFYVAHSGSIRRLTYSGSNRAPTAVATATPTSGGAPLTVSFNGSGSSDPDAGDVLSYSWDLNGDGVFGDSTIVNPSFTYTTPGSRNVQLRVTDLLGLSNTTTVLVSVNNTVPTAIIDLPLSSLTWKVGDVISFSGHGSDAEDGTLPASGLSWTLVLLHGNAGAPGYHEHIVQGFAGVAGGSFTAPDHEYPSKLELRLVATDSGGLAANAAVDLEPVTVGLTFQSSPAGLALSVNGASSVAPFSRTVIVGSSNSVSAASPQTLGATSYNFSSWSDAGAQSHNVIAPGSAATYTANYVAAPPPPPTVSINDVSVTEGNAGTTNAVFTVTLSAAATQAVSVNWSTANGTATAGSDYTAVTNGLLTIPAGATSAAVTVVVAGDTLVETSETLLVNLSNPVNATIADAQGAGTIIDDDVVIGGLVLALGFEEGNGTNTSDASGTGNNGALNGAAWSTSGKFGKALSFNGVSNWVTVADSNSLDLTNRMTFEAWVKPAALSGWTTVLIKERGTSGLAYSLYASDDTGKPPAAYIRRTNDVAAAGTSALPLNTWSHLAATYDGAALRLYVNGTLARTTNVTGNVAATANPLRIGGNAVWGEWFAGLIDEVRVYNRALAASEIQADMNAPVVAGTASAGAGAAAAMMAAPVSSGTGGSLSTTPAAVAESVLVAPRRTTIRHHRPRHGRAGLLTIADPGALGAVGHRRGSYLHRNG